MDRILNNWSEQLGYLQIVAAAVIWGSYGLFVRTLNYPPEVIVFFRFLFGFLSLTAFIGLRGNFPRPQQLPRFRVLLFAALINSISWLTYTGSLMYTSVANAVFLLYTAPCFVVLLAPFFFKERIEMRSVLALILSLAGVVGIMGYSGVRLDAGGWQGNVLALVGGFAYAVFILIVKCLPPTMLGLTSNLYSSLFIALVSFPLAVRYFPLLTLPGLLVLMAVGVVQQGFGSTLYHTGLGRVKAQQASILTYLDPLSAVIFAFVFLHEPLTGGSIAGGLLILAGGTLILRSDPPAGLNSKPLHQGDSV